MRYPLIVWLMGLGGTYAQTLPPPETIVSLTESMRKIEMARVEKAGNQGTEAADFSLASSNFNVHHVSLHVSIDPSARYIKGFAGYHFILNQKSDSVILDLHNALTVDSVLFRGNSISFGRVPDHGISIRFPVSLEKNSADSFVIFYRGTPPGNNSTGAFYQGAHAGTPVVWTLSEPYGSREWWPCKNNLTDKIDSIDIHITCPQQYQPSSNGMLISNTTNGMLREAHFRHRYPISAYLVAIAVTNYVMNRDTVRVGSNVYNYLSFAYPENATSFFSNEVASKEAFRLYSRLFGLYPFAGEKYGHTQWGWNGGMEHQTNSFQINTSSNLSAHELAHQWFGDKVTCGSWSDIWLNEGFATYASILYLEATNRSLFYGQLQGLINNITAVPGGSVYVYDTTNVGNIFSGRLSYNKGSYVLHMLRWVMGDSLFFRGINHYLNDPTLSFGYARTSDLIRNLEKAGGKPLTSFFRDWVYREGFPSYQAVCTQNANNWINIKLHQTTSHNSVPFFSLPVEVRFKGKNSEYSTVLDHAHNDQLFWVNPGFPVDSVIIDPALWILAKTKSASLVRSALPVDDIIIFPNPASDITYVQINNPSNPVYEITLLSLSGQVLHQTVQQTPGKDETIAIPLTGLPKATYVVKVTSNGKIRKTQPIIRN